jgi:hypothetical protein
MELPFTLTETRDGRLRYGIALWYRLMAAVVLGILSWTLVAQGQPPSVVGWLLLGLAALGVLYEERWTFGAGGTSHAVGLVFAARRVELARGDLAALRIVPHVRGTIPGSAEEARENSRAMNGQADAEPYARKPAFWKRPTLILVLSTRDGSEYAIDKVPARNRERIRETARRIGERTGLELRS